MNHTRREFITGGLAALAGCATTKNTTKRRSRKYNFGANLLTFEKVAGLPVSEECYTHLDEIVTEAREKTRDISQPKKNLQTVDAILKAHFTFNESVLNSSEMMSDLLLPGKKKTANAFLASYLYLTIAEEQKWPLSGVFAPDYFFVRWSDEKSHFNWDAQLGAKILTADYIRELRIPQTAIDNGTYLRPLSLREIFGLHLTVIAVQETEEVDLKRLEYFTNGIALNVRNPRGLNNTGLYWIKLNSYKMALPYFNAAILYDPSFKEAEKNRIRCLEVIEKSKSEMH